jgi:hypothetical protein
MSGAIGALARRAAASQRASLAALANRSLSSSPAAAHVQPAPAEEDTAAAAPRWLRELGAVRTDWT